MKLHDLRPDEGNEKGKRGRVWPGHGKTAGRGTMGQNARSGGGVSPYLRVPASARARLPFKRGFSNIFRTNYQKQHRPAWDRSRRGEITPEALAAAGLVRDANEPVVILGRGELGTAFTVKAHRFSKSAREKIEAAGGTVEELELLVTGARATVKLLPKEQLEALRSQRGG